MSYTLTEASNAYLHLDNVESLKQNKIQIEHTWTNNSMSTYSSTCKA